MATQSDSIELISAALAKAQGVLDPPTRNREVEVKTKTSGIYKFKYTTLDFLIEHVREALTANGLWFIQTISCEGEEQYLETTLTHSSGQWIRGRAGIPRHVARAQEFGAMLTYMRRYTLTAMLGIASEEDADAPEDDIKVTQIKDAVDPPTKPNAKKLADEWLANSLKLVLAFKSIEELSEWELSNAKQIVRSRGYNETAHKRLIEAIQKRQADLEPMGAG